MIQASLNACSKFWKLLAQRVLLVRWRLSPQSSALAEVAPRTHTVAFVVLQLLRHVPRRHCLKHEKTKMCLAATWKEVSEMQPKTRRGLRDQ